MKFSSIMAVFAVAIAFAATGCKYDKAGAGAGAGGADDASATGSDISGISSEEGDISAASSSGNFEDMYTKCTDVSFAPVYFGFDSTVVPQGELSKIDAVVEHLNSRSDRVVVVEGHCDERGSNEYNMALGENRATIIRNYMVQSGISDDRIQTRTYGEEKPASEGHDESAWSVNRRGEFGIYQK
jgi:peptidoglycan-associated lipoprotein